MQEKHGATSLSHDENQLFLWAGGVGTENKEQASFWQVPPHHEPGDM